MGCGCPSGHTTVLNSKVHLSESSSLASPLSARPIFSRSNTLFPSLYRFTLRSELVDYFYRDPFRPTRNRRMIKSFNRTSICVTSADGTEKPSETVSLSKYLRLEYVYGCKCCAAAGNVHYTADPDVLVYPSGAIAVLLTKSSNSQTYLGAGDVYEVNGHSDEIQAVAISEGRDILATGDIGSNPLICIWQINGNKLPIASFAQGEGSVGVWKLSFSRDLKYILSVDLAKQQKVRIYEWKLSSPLLYTYSCTKGHILNSSWHPTIYLFCTIDPVIFWTFGLDGFVKNSGKFESNCYPANMNDVSWLSNGNCLTAGQNGRIYVWYNHKTLKSVQILSEDMPIFVIKVVNEVVVVGGEGYFVYVLDAALQKLQEVAIPSSPISLDWNNGTILCGTKDGVIQELRDQMRIVLMDSHSQGSVWGLAIHPTNPSLFISTGDDNTIKVWDMSQRKCISTGVLEAAMGPTAETEGNSDFARSKQSRAVAISRSEHVAVGHNDGHVTVRAGVRQLNNIIAVMREPQDWVQALTYSPSGKWLAVGSHDNGIYVYSAYDSYSPVHKLVGRNGPVASLDWSKDEVYLRSCDINYEPCLWHLPTDSQVPHLNSPTDDTSLATWTSAAGWPVRGIRHHAESPDFILSVSCAPDRKTVAVGNAWGLVELYAYPNEPGVRAAMYRAHSLEVVKVVWNDKGTVLLSAGGHDLAIMQWAVVGLRSSKGCIKDIRHSYKSIR